MFAITPSTRLRPSPFFEAAVAALCGDWARGLQPFGALTDSVGSRRLHRTIGYAPVERVCRPGDRVEVLRDRERLTGTLTDLPFIR